MKQFYSSCIQNYTYRLYLIAIAVLSIVSIVVEKGHDVLWINSRHTPFLDAFFTAVTNLGDGLILIPLVTVLLFVRFQYALAAVLIGVSNGILVTILKHIIFLGFGRPKSILDPELLYFVPGVNVHGAHSFPSGHTTTAFCFALFIALIVNKRYLNLLLLIVALVVGISRIYLLQHFLMDVAAGAALGSITTLIVFEFIRTTPQPSWLDFRLRIRAPFNKKFRKLGSRTLTTR